MADVCRGSQRSGFGGPAGAAPLRAARAARVTKPPAMLLLGTPCAQPPPRGDQDRRRDQADTCPQALGERWVRRRRRLRQLFARARLEQRVVSVVLLARGAR